MIGNVLHHNGCFNAENIMVNFLFLAQSIFWQYEENHEKCVLCGLVACHLGAVNLQKKKSKPNTEICIRPKLFAICPKRKNSRLYTLGSRVSL